MKRLLQTLLSFALLASIAAADTDSFTFTNNTGQDANDLHIEWSRGVKVTKCDKFKKYTDTEKSRSDFSKGEVKDGETCEVTVTYDGTDPKVKSFYWTKDGKNIGNGDLKKDIVSLSVDHLGDLMVTTLTSSAGTIRTYLPEDVRTGDTITGTVIMTPDPSNPDAQATLTGTVIQVGDSKAKISGNTLMATIGATALTHIAFTQGSSSAGSCPLPIGSGNAPPIDPTKTIIGQTGHPLTLPFSGDPSRPITAAFGDTQVPVLAGTPRSLILGTPQGAVGGSQVSISADGEKHEYKVVMLDLKLSAPKTTLLKGEQTSLKLEVRGLQDLPESAYPLDIRLVNLTPSIVQLSESTNPSLQMVEIQRSDVGPSGTAALSVPLQAIESGSFQVSGNIAAEKCDSTRTLLKIEKLSKGKDKDGYFVKVRRDTYEGTCHKKKGHSGEHGYSWKKTKTGEEEITHFKTQKERDDFFKSMEEAKKKIDDELSK